MPDESILTPAEAAFLAAARTAVLATTDPEGRPRLVPICFAPGGPDGAGRPRIHSPLDEKPKRVADPRDLERVRDLLARPAVGLLVERWSEDWDRLGWLRLDGRGELLEPPDPGAEGGEERAAADGAEHATAVASLRAKYPQYAGHRLEERPMLRFTIERARSWGDLSVDDPQRSR